MLANNATSEIWKNKNKNKNTHKDLGYYYLLFIIYSYFVMATGDHPQEDDQAIFGYRPDIKISQNLWILYILAIPAGNLF